MWKLQPFHFLAVPVNDLACLAIGVLDDAEPCSCCLCLRGCGSSFAPVPSFTLDGFLDPAVIKLWEQPWHQGIRSGCHHQGFGFGACLACSALVTGLMRLMQSLELLLDMQQMLQSPYAIGIHV